jgi:hypothetical protein
MNTDLSIMITITVQLSEGIRCILEKNPSTLVVESPQSVTIKRLARDVGVPPILVAFAIANGEKKNLDDVIDRDARVHLFGTMAGG